MFDIIRFVFETLGKLFSVMQEFEIFPGVPFGSLLFGFFLLSIFLRLFFDNLYSDFISDSNIFDSFDSFKSKPTKEEYIGKHEYKPKHAKKER